MNKMNKIGAFCETYGKTISNRILEYILENQDMDFAVGDMAKEVEVSKPKAYETIRTFEDKEYIKKSRLVGKTQLLKDFKECLKIVADEYSEEIKLNKENQVLARVIVNH